MPPGCEIANWNRLLVFFIASTRSSRRANKNKNPTSEPSEMSWSNLFRLNFNKIVSSAAMAAADLDELSKNERWPTGLPGANKATLVLVLMPDFLVSVTTI